MTQWQMAMGDWSLCPKPKWVIRSLVWVSVIPGKFALTSLCGILHANVNNSQSHLQPIFWESTNNCFKLPDSSPLRILKVLSRIHPLSSADIIAIRLEGIGIVNSIQYGCIVWVILSVVHAKQRFFTYR